MASESEPLQEMTSDAPLHYGQFSVEPTQGSSLPVGFGVGRDANIGMGSHSLIYEYEYHPEPIRQYSSTKPEVCESRLRPPVHKGKVPFQFFGVRVPTTADHARCWLGQVLLAETKLGRLQKVEFIVDVAEPLKSLGTPYPHGPQPTWRWHAWLPGKDADAAKRPPPVEVIMVLSPAEGIAIDLYAKDEDERNYVYRVLRQYCDDDSKSWHPIPDPPAKVSKVIPRHSPPDVELARRIGVSVPDSNTKVMKDWLCERQGSEAVLVRALMRAQVCCDSATFDDLLHYAQEVLNLVHCIEGHRQLIRQEWRQTIGQVLGSVLRRALESGDRERLASSAALIGEKAEHLDLHAPEDLKARAQDILSS